MQHVLAVLQQEKSSRYSILIFVISLFEFPLPWMPGAVDPPPLQLTLL